MIEYVPADMTITVEAGMSLGALQDTLAGEGQFLPIDAPASSTVGGALSVARTGPSAHLYGLPRDWLIGCRAALADGSIIKGGGRVVKNVAGYDIPRLVVGSLGTLGVIVEATFKVAPLPRMDLTLVATFPSSRNALESVFRVDERRLAMRSVALDLRRDGEGATGAIRLSGAERSVARSVSELSSLLGEAVMSTRTFEGAESSQWWTERALPLRGDPERVSVWISVQRSRVSELIDMVLDDRQAMIRALPTIGWLEVDTVAEEAPVANLRDKVTSCGGTCIVAVAPLQVKAKIDVWDGESGPLDLMRRLKAEFDPRGVLNRGRFAGGI
jgi:glycolate oxidase FAD binding subunit